MTAPKRPNYKKASTELAQRVLWALKFAQVPGGGGLYFDLKTGASMPWQDWFMDALDGVGYCIDRKAYYARGKKCRGKP